MTILKHYHHFDGRHWETGTLCNVLAYQGVTAPHTGKPLSEALLFGIGGGIVAGYFTFEYSGLDPSLNFLTRNTFEPGDMIRERLRIPTEVKQTDNPDKAAANLTRVLDDGKPALVWGDLCQYPYFNMPPNNQLWLMFPVVVYGYDADSVSIADRAKVGLTVSVDELAKARARTSANKHRLMTLGAPNLDTLPAAVEAGIQACVSSFLDEPPRGQMKGKYGLDAFTHWMNLLADTSTKKGWAKSYPPGAKFYTMLKSGYHYVHFWGGDSSGSRGVYADFLDEAATILSKPALKDVAAHYRTAASLWDAMLRALLPDSIAPFKDTRELMQRSFGLFIEQGGASLPERQQISTRLKTIRDEMDTHFPLNERESAALRDQLRDQLQHIHDAEQAAVLALRDAMVEKSPA